ncbi:hypothetical protein E2C01_029406 [Portunus trituberculatus]|uniref:Uncharacterized protein n=1 Tax=Portunus trituberculatus TaxID=210409 RepID=A0A5B7ERV8_PORTR|nr:hypothetical protein [Portunus trituberculatus]
MEVKRYTSRSTYYQEQQLQPLVMRNCGGTSNSSIVGSTSKDGAFYRASNIAKFNEDWGVFGKLKKRLGMIPGRDIKYVRFRRWKTQVPTLVCLHIIGISPDSNDILKTDANS